MATDLPQHFQRLYKVWDGLQSDQCKPTHGLGAASRPSSFNCSPAHTTLCSNHRPGADPHHMLDAFPQMVQKLQMFLVHQMEPEIGCRPRENLSCFFTLLVPDGNILTAGKPELIPKLPLPYTADINKSSSPRKVFFIRHSFYFI